MAVIVNPVRTAAEAQKEFVDSHKEVVNPYESPSPPSQKAPGPWNVVSVTPLTSQSQPNAFGHLIPKSSPWLDLAGHWLLWTVVGALVYAGITHAFRRMREHSPMEWTSLRDWLQKTNGWQRIGLVFSGMWWSAIAATLLHAVFTMDRDFSNRELWEISFMLVLPLLFWVGSFLAIFLFKWVAVGFFRDGKIPQVLVRFTASRVELPIWALILIVFAAVLIALLISPSPHIRRY